MKNLICFCFILLCSLLKAQSPVLESISIEQGLSQGFVPSICQDDDGLLWFATKNGLNRYDGYRFLVFQNDPFDSLSLNNNEIIYIVAAGDFLFVVTVADKPMLFHRKTHRFYPVPHMFPGNRGVFGGAGTLGKDAIYAWYWDGYRCRTYCLRWPPFLSDSLLSGKKVTPVERLLQVDSVPEPQEFLGLGVSANGKQFWFMTKNDIQVRDIGSGSTRKIPIPSPVWENEIKPGAHTIIVSDFYGATWVFAGRTVLCFNGTDWHTFSLPFTVAGLVCADRKSGLVWLRTNDMVYGIDLGRKQFQQDPDWTLTIGCPVKGGFSDRSGIFWIGTDAHGIRKFSPRSTVFRNYLEGYSVYCQPLYNGKNHVLVTDVRHGEVTSKILDLTTGQTHDFSHPGLDAPLENHICATENGCFWYAYAATGGINPTLVRYNPETGTKEKFSIPAYFQWNVPVLKYVSPGQIWIISPHQFVRFETSTRKFTLFETKKEMPEQIFAIERSPAGIWWMATTDGLIRAETLATGDLRTLSIKSQKGNRNSLPTNSIKSLLVDPDDPDILWIGTNGKGLTRLDLRKNRFTQYTYASGALPDDVVYGILADDEKPRRLWISTNRGLTRFDPASGYSQHFTRTDGLQDNEFNTYASYKDPSGKLFFGGVNGLTFFNPKDLSGNLQQPDLLITNLNINGTNISPGDSSGILTTDIAFCKKIELQPSQNNIQIQFAVMDFSSPARNQFSYYLEGAEKPWVHRGFDHSAQYLNLSPGTYVLRVKAANSQGIWSRQPVSLKIVIRSPWYLTWPAYLLYAVLFVIAGFFFNQYQLIQRLKTAETKRLKNLDQFKNRFYTNITHEFRTPLTVILGMTDRLMSENKTAMQPLTLIRRNGENLLRLINQILDLARLESHELKINNLQGDIISYLRYISESLHSLANAQNVMLKVTSDLGKIIMDYDPERLLQIVHNLLSNAIKFTPSGGNVTMKATVSGKILLITVTDTGIGIRSEDLPYIFDRFFQAKMQELKPGENPGRADLRSGGTGIGLSLTKELVLAMGGKIRVESPLPGNIPGTVFTVELPVGNQAPMVEEAVDEYRVSRQTDAIPFLQNQGKSDTCVLLIDDNPDVMEYLASCLGDQYRLEYAFNGRAGIEKALELVPDLIVSDVMMPEKDGLEVCDFLKNDERTSHIPLILLTARVTVEDRIAGLRRGADAYLAKPFHEEELLVWIEQLTARQRMLQARWTNFAVKTTPEEIPSFLAESQVLEDAFVVRFKTILEANYPDPEISADTLAEKMGMSRPQLYRKIKSLTGRPIIEHLNAIRLEKAKALLKTGGFNISEAAYQVGYNDPKYFGRLFAEAFGQSPSDYIKNC
ncbi:MAG: ATP-binding protein [Bacteroidota bacterium]